MKVIRNYNDLCERYDYRLDDGNNALVISFQGNLDLYFALRSENIDINKSNDFIITKENMTIYNLFENLYNDIKNINLFDETVYTETDKTGYRLYNKSNYNELYNSDTNIITWYSDETAHEVANILKIKKEDEKYILNFFVQPSIKGYYEDFYSKYSIIIRFSNSGSRYAPFNICFMRLYNNLQKYDPEYHQMTIEEYGYKRKVLKNEKK